MQSVKGRYIVTNVLKPKTSSKEKHKCCIIYIRVVRVKYNLANTQVKVRTPDLDNSVHSHIALTHRTHTSHSHIALKHRTHTSHSHDVSFCIAKHSLLSIRKKLVAATRKQGDTTRLCCYNIKLSFWPFE